jgi:hypothetical protein
MTTIAVVLTIVAAVIWIGLAASLLRGRRANRHQVWSELQTRRRLILLHLKM